MAYTSHGHHINGTHLEDRPIGLLTARCGGPHVCQQCAHDALEALYPVSVADEVVLEPKPEKLTHDHETMTKVYDALARIGLSPQQVLDVVADMQGQGILFREGIKTT